MLNESSSLIVRMTGEIKNLFFNLNELYRLTVILLLG